jgi:dihydropteroate synthase
MAWVAPKIMGVVNTTPDSFSDGGLFLSAEAAVAQAKLLLSQGATIIDVGGESTRPGAQRVSLLEEQDRVLPVIRAIKSELQVEISIDTMNAETAKLAVEAGADYVNDVSGGLADRSMFSTIAPLSCKYILGHWRGHSNVMDQLTGYKDIAKEVVAELSEQVSVAVATGIARDRLIVDPGLGFAKDVDENWELVARLDELENLGLPILVGASRKRFLAAVLDQLDPKSVANPRRDMATAVLTALLLQRGIWGVRVHNVELTADTIAIVKKLKESTK